jgi:nitroreductase
LDVKEAIDKRRAYRSFDKFEVTEELVDDLSRAASLSPSCFNHQPWRYVFVYEHEMLEKMKEALKPGNAWAFHSSMFIAVFSKKDYDCLIKEREYYLFDTGMASAFLILRATELGLVAHPIAGFSPKKTKEILGLPEDVLLLTLICVGKKSDSIRPELSEKQIGWEKNRPERKNFKEFRYLNRYRP